MIFIIYWLVILEGVLRKWVFPDLHRIFFFVRDPFVLWVYFLAFSYNMWPRTANNYFFIGGILLSIFGLILGFLQIIFIEHNLLISGYGWRNYFFLIPLAFLIGHVFYMQDIDRLIKQSLIIAIPCAILVFFQFLSPASAPINQGFGTATKHTFDNLGVAWGIVRPFGFFTSTAGQVMFIGSVVAMLLNVWILPKKDRPLDGFMLIIATGAVMAMLALSGSRGAFALSFVIILTSIISGIIMRRSNISIRASVFPIILVLFGIAILPYVFPLALDALLYRTIGASASANVPTGVDLIYRVIHGMTHFIELILVVPPMGYGLGIAGNAGTTLGQNASLQYLDIEGDLGRNIVDLGPILGLMYISYRFSLLVWLAVGAVRATRCYSHPLPILLVGFIGLTLLFGQMTGHGTISGYAWLFVGFVMAANNSLKNRKNPEYEQNTLQIIMVIYIRLFHTPAFTKNSAAK
jgi:hypothetical protein